MAAFALFSLLLIFHSNLVNHPAPFCVLILCAQFLPATLGPGKWGWVCCGKQLTLRVVPGEGSDAVLAVCRPWALDWGPLSWQLVLSVFRAVWGSVDIAFTSLLKFQCLLFFLDPLLLV